MDRIQLRRDSSARWAEINPILLEGEVGYEIDTKLRKIGDGVHRWNDLEYLKAEGISQETGNSQNITMSQDAITRELSELGSKDVNNYFIGTGTITQTKIDGLLPNRTYRVYIGNDWNDITDNTDAMKFYISSFKGGVETGLGGWKIGSVAPLYVEFVTPNDFDYVVIGGRASEGEKIWFRIELQTDFNTGVSLISTRDFIPDINTNTMTLDLGEDPIVLIGGKSYVLSEIHDDESVYRSISLPFNESTSGALVMVFNTNLKTLYTKVYSKERNLYEVVIGGIRLHYSSSQQKFYFMSANFPFDYTIDGQKQWSKNVEALEKSVDDIKDATYELAARDAVNYFVGLKTGYSSIKIEGLIPNHSYRVFLRDSWEDSTDNTKVSKFAIESFNGTSLSVLADYKIGTEIPSYIDITIPNDSQYIVIGGRAYENKKVWFVIKDLWVNSKVGFSLIPTRGFLPNINTESLILDLGDDPVFVIGDKSYALASIHSDASVYRSISLPVGESKSGALVMVFNIETKTIYSKIYTSIQNLNEVVIGGVRLHYSSSQGKFYFISANFMFDYTIDGQRGWGNDFNKLSDKIDGIDVDSDVASVNGGVPELTSKFKDLCKRKGVYGNSNYGNKIVNILFTSDSHNQTAYLKRIINFKNKFSEYIDDIVHGGDAVYDQFVDDNPFASIDGGEYVLNTIGNHDVDDVNNVTGNSTDGIVHQKNVYDKFISPYIANWGNDINPITQPSGADDYGYCYYCKDYTESKVRLIVLDCMNYNEHQNEWLSSILDDAITRDYHVMICNHYTPSKKFKPDYNCTFSSIYQGPSIVGQTLPDLASDIVQSKIDNGLKLICWIFGHYHRDYFGSLSNYPNQFGLAVDKTAPMSTWERDCTRSGNGRSKDAFNVISIDSTHGIMTVMRIGNNRDKFMRQKNYLVFDYLNSRLIYNS